MRAEKAAQLLSTHLRIMKTWVWYTENHVKTPSMTDCTYNPNARETVRFLTLTGQQICQWMPMYQSRWAMFLRRTHKVVHWTIHTYRGKEKALDGSLLKVFYHLGIIQSIHPHYCPHITGHTSAAHHLQFSLVPSIPAIMISFLAWNKADRPFLSPHKKHSSLRYLIVYH